MGFFNDPNGWLQSAVQDVSNVVSGVGNAVNDIANSDVGKAAAVIAAIYFGAPYLGLTGEAAASAAAADAATIGSTAEGAAALQAAATEAGAGAGVGAGGAGAGIGVAAPAGYAGAADAALATGAALTPAALESQIGTAGYGVNAAAGAGSGLGAYATNLGATAAGIAGAGAAGATPWYLQPSVIQGAASLGSGLIGAYGATKAADTSAAASANALALQKQIYDQQTALNAPYNAAGVTAQNKMLSLLGLGGDTTAPGYGKYAKDFSMADYTADPGYAFRLSEGMKQLTHNAAGRGGLISGGTMKGIQDYAQSSASQEYGNAYQRYLQNRQNQLQPLANLTTSGLSAANQQSAAAGTYGANASNTLTNAGNVAGSAQLGAATTLGNALNTGATAYQNQSNFNNWLASQKPNASAYVG